MRARSHSDPSEFRHESYYAEPPQIVQARSGASVDVSGKRWQLSADHWVTWEHFEELPYVALSALKDFACHLIRTRSDSYVRSQVGFLRYLRHASVVAEFRRSVELDTIGRSVLEAFKAACLTSVSLAQLPSYTGAFVRWYIWCADAGWPTFDPDVASELELMKIGSNPSGQAVLRQDPDSGPLRDVEMIALRTALKKAEAEQNLTVADLSLCWLFLSLGTNPRSLLWLNEEDLIVTQLNDGGNLYELRVPRIKKKTAKPRDQFRVRRLVPQVGSLLERLIAENRDAHSSNDQRDRPLFRMRKPRKRIAETQFDAQAYRPPPGWALRRLKAVSEILDLRAFNGGRLMLHPRRLRYSFATRLIQEGASPQEVADALDHSSMNHVQVYFNARSDAVQRLDEKMSFVLAPVAQAFLGTLIRDERAVCGDDRPQNLIRHFDGTKNAFEAVGSCGSFGFCGLAAPLACYTCLHFQAWVDAPHGEVLRGLEERRAQKVAEGADFKWVQIYDETMLAVAEVIIRCGEECAGGNSR